MTHHLAQINIGRLIAPVDDPKIAEFVAQLDPVNALADTAPGFVWRLQSSSGNATDIVYNDDPFVIVNMSVWESVEALRDFVYKSNHLDVLRDRAKWFEKMEKPHYCLGGFQVHTFQPLPRAASGWSIINNTEQRRFRSGFRSFIRRKKRPWQIPN